MNTLIVDIRLQTIKLASWFWKQPTFSLSASPTSSSTSPSAMSDQSKQNLSSPPTQPTGPQLTPQLCFNTTYLRDFLRTSRAQLDDTISTSLNSLLTPSTTSPFNPLSTSSPTSNRRSTRQPISQSACSTFLDRTLFPSWDNRSRILSYCSVVASSPDPNDPNLEQIKLDNARGEARLVDERLDPYSGRFFPREPRTEQLALLLRNENAVEGIIRERTWRILQERCEGLGGGFGEKWEDALDRWRKESGTR